MHEIFQPVGKILKEYFGFNAARIRCLLLLIEAMVKAKTVNLSALSHHFYGTAELESHYRRCRRFVAEVLFDAGARARFIVACSPLKHEKKWTLILDRTNWKFGKKHINILFLAVAHHRIAIPLFGHS